MPYVFNPFTGNFDWTNPASSGGTDNAPTELEDDEIFTIADKRQTVFGHPITMGVNSRIAPGENSALVGV